MVIHRRLALAVLVLAWLPAGLQGQNDPSKPEGAVGAPSAIEGYWQDVEDSESVLAFERGLIIEGYRDKLQLVAKVLRVESWRIALCDRGRDASREWSVSGDELMLRNPASGERNHLRRLASRPTVLDLEPLALPPPRPLSAERIDQIQTEIGLHRKKDAQAQDINYRPVSPRPLFFAEPERDHALDPNYVKALSLINANASFLKSLISGVGWIDAGRFGTPIADSAWLLVQHSFDLKLMLTALPFVKADADAGRLAKADYALLYDRVQVWLGERQRYGTQLVDDRFGPLIAPVEDPASVDRLRESMGIPPLAGMLRALGTSEVRFSTECGAATAAKSDR